MGERRDLDSLLSSMTEEEKFSLAMVLAFMQDEDFDRLMEEEEDRIIEYLKSLVNGDVEKLPDYLIKYCISDDEETDLY